MHALKISLTFVQIFGWKTYKHFGGGWWNVFGGGLKYFLGRGEIFSGSGGIFFGERWNIFWGVVEYFDWQFYRKCGAEGLSDQVEVQRRGRWWAGNGSGTTPANVEQLGGCPLPSLIRSRVCECCCCCSCTSSTKQQSTLHRVQTVPDS